MDSNTLLALAKEAIDRIHASGPFEIKDAWQRGKDVVTIKKLIQRIDEQNGCLKRWINEDMTYRNEA